MTWKLSWLIIFEIRQLLGNRRQGHGVAFRRSLRSALLELRRRLGNLLRFLILPFFASSSSSSGSFLIRLLPRSVGVCRGLLT